MLQRLSNALGSGKWWFATALSMGAGWGLVYALSRALWLDVGWLYTLVAGAVPAFIGALAQTMSNDTP
jgi:hypothetical protein